VKPFAISLTTFLFCFGIVPAAWAQEGTISDGHCRWKDLCDVGRSAFSEGRTVAQCKVRCQQAFSGCTKGEIRSKQRRD